MKHLTPQVPYLLAKWRDDKSFFWPIGHNLIGHINSCSVMGNYILDRTRFGKRLFEVMALERFTTWETFRRLCLLSVLCHDLGKSGSEFQEFLWQLEHLYQKWEADKDPDKKPFRTPWGDDRYPQKYRHEALSAVLILKTPAIYDWVVREAGSEELAAIVISGAMGHHRKTPMERAFKDQESTQKRTVFLADLSQKLNRLSPHYGFQPFPVCENVEYSAEDAHRVIRSFHASHEDEDEETPLSAAVKYVTVLADVFGSMSPKTEAEKAGYHDRLKWSLDRVTRRPLGIHFRRHLIANGWKKHLRLYPFQRAARDSNKNDDVVLAAACGRGKSWAAYMWADVRRDRKLIFTTPTTATATQINQDLIIEGKAGKDKTANRHSRQAVDAMLLKQDREDARKNMESKGIHITPTLEASEAEDVAIKEEYAKLLYDFMGFDCEVTHATVDQVLGVLAYSHRSILWLLYLVDAQIVFDEFHCYDKTMQKWFTRFLEWFPGIRFMCMSATIADEQLEAVLSARPKTKVIRDDDKDSPAKRPRYHIHIVSREEAEKHFGNGTLWIVNQVKRSQEIGEAFPDEGTIVCHSRFQYKGRRKIQRDMVEGFRKLSKGKKVKIRAAATQVAEMSLDISAQTMISEIADPASDIQRLGRLNREAYTDKVCHAYFYMPENGLPYSQSMSAFENSFLPWLQNLADRDLSQDDLSNAFKEYKGVTEIEEVPLFLPMTHTKRYPIRQQQTATLGLWEDDLPKDPKARRRMPMRELQALEIPLYLTPKERQALVAQGKWFKYRYILSAPNFHYDKRLGLIKTFNDFEGLVEGGDEE